MSISNSNIILLSQNSKPFCHTGISVSFRLKSIVCSFNNWIWMFWMLESINHISEHRPIKYPSIIIVIKTEIACEFVSFVILFVLQQKKSESYSKIIRFIFREFFFTRYITLFCFVLNNESILKMKLECYKLASCDV